MGYYIYDPEIQKARKNELEKLKAEFELGTFEGDELPEEFEELAAQIELLEQQIEDVDGKLLLGNVEGVDKIFMNTGAINRLIEVNSLDQSSVSIMAKSLDKFREDGGNVSKNIPIVTDDSYLHGFDWEFTFKTVKGNLLAKSIKTTDGYSRSLIEDQILPDGLGSFYERFIADIKNKQEDMKETIEVIAESSMGEGFLVSFDILKEYEELTGETPTFMGIT